MRPKIGFRSHQDVSMMQRKLSCRHLKLDGSVVISATLGARMGLVRRLIPSWVTLAPTTRPGAFHEGRLQIRNYFVQPE